MADSANLRLTQIWQCFKQIDTIFHTYAAEQQLSDSAFWILYTLCLGDGPYTQNDLCEECCFSKQTTHSAVAGLVKAGYVRLEHLPGSRNSKSVALTPAGHTYADAHIRPAMRAEFAAFDRLSTAEQDAYYQLVRRHLTLFGEEVAALKEPHSSEDLLSQRQSR